MRADRLSQAEALLRQAPAQKRDTLGDQPLSVLKTQQALATNLAQQHRSDEVLALLETRVAYRCAR